MQCPRFEPQTQKKVNVVVDLWIWLMFDSEP